MVAKGFGPAFFNKVNPLKGPLEAGLKPRAAPTMPPSQIILGRVLDPAKKPLANAVVSVEDTTVGNVTYGSPPAGTAPLAVTDELGEFESAAPRSSIRWSCGSRPAVSPGAVFPGPAPDPSGKTLR